MMDQFKISHYSQTILRGVATRLIQHQKVKNVQEQLQSAYRALLPVRGITVLCHFRKNYIMLVIICKNDKHLVTLYNVIFSNMSDILSHLSYIFY